MAFADPEIREQIPDPQDPNTFTASRLLWEEREMEPHASTLRFYQKLLALRRSEPALRAREANNYEVVALDQDVLLLRRHADRAPTLLAVFRLRGAGAADLRGNPHAAPGAGLRWTHVLTSEERSFVTDPMPAQMDFDGPVVDFARPGVVVLKSTRAHQSGGR